MTAQRPEASPHTLADLAVATPARVVSVGPDHARLAMHGFRPGAVVAVDHDAPFGGPRVVRLAAARVAVARSAARAVIVVPDATDLPP